jgi:hypothetical protein
MRNGGLVRFKEFERTRKRKKNEGKSDNWNKDAIGNSRTNDDIPFNIINDIDPQVNHSPSSSVLHCFSCLNSEMRYLAQTMRWPTTIDMDDAFTKVLCTAQCRGYERCEWDSVG